MNKKLLFGGFIAVLVLSLSLILILANVQKKQETQSRASAATILSFTPYSSANTPIIRKVNDTITVMISLNPGTNYVSLVKLQILFDPSKFQGTGNSTFVLNSNIMPTIVEGPVIDNGNGMVAATVSVGNDPTRVIKTTSTIATINLKAIAPTDTGNSKISFGTQSQAFSLAATDQPFENVLATALPAYVYINNTLAPTAAPTQTNRQQLTGTPSLTPSPTVKPILTGTMTAEPLALSFKVNIHGIGFSGDSTNQNSSLSNKNPQRTDRKLNIDIYNSANQLVLTRIGTVSYDETNGNFAGIIDLGVPLPLGDYIVKVKTDSYLRKSLPGFLHLTATTVFPVVMPAVTLVAGDVNSDNAINIFDYNGLMGCYSDLLPATFCDDDRKELTDLNDDGDVNQLDYNFFLREVTNQKGD